MDRPAATTGITEGLRMDIAARDAEITMLLSEISERDDTIAELRESLASAQRQLMRFVAAEEAVQ